MSLEPSKVAVDRRHDILLGRSRRIPRMSRFASLLAASLVVSTLAVFAMPGCSNQGEGERCDPNNNNDDCASGLTCQTIAGQPSPLCCPPAPQQPTVAECFAGQAPLPEAGSEASTQPEASTDAAPEASADAADDTTADVESADAADDASSDAAEPADAESDAAGE